MSSPALRVMTCNALKDLTDEQVVTLLAKVSPLTDVILWQELSPRHKRRLRQMAGWSHYLPPQPWGVGISWRTGRFTVARTGMARTEVPGIKGVDPARGFADIVLKDKLTQQLWPVLTTHMTHQAWTSHPERRPRWWAEALRLRLRSARLANRWGRVVGGGDMNRHQWAPVGTTGLWSTRGTYGKAKYDTLWYRGKVTPVGGAVTIGTPSDHDSLVSAFRVL